MNTSNQNHDPAQPHDLPDRLVDLALSELIGGNTPPDLSSRIAAATLRQPATPAAIGQVPRARQQDRAFWVNLAIAVMLLIGVSVVLVPSFHAARKTPPRVARLGAEFQNHHDPSKPFPGATTSQRGIAKSQNAAGKPADFDSLSELIQSTVDSSAFGDAKAAKSTSNFSLQISQRQRVNAGLAQGPNHPAGPEGKPQPVELYTAGRTATPALQPALGNLGPNGSAPNQKPNQPQFQSDLDDALYAKDDIGSIADLTDSTTGVGDRSKQTIAGSYEWKETPSVVRGMESRESGDRYTQIVENPFIKAEGGAAVSTFSIDVDTASYANVRQFLQQMNQLPPPDAVRIEELVNYFKYDYAGPPSAPAGTRDSGSAGGSTTDNSPFAAHVEVTACPWAPEHRLARIGIKGREMDRNKRPQSNLVFLVDVSGSMNEPAKLPLVVYGLEQLTHELGENDHIAIVVYAGTEGLVLPSTSGSKQVTILAALAKLQAGGSTAGGAGIQLAYQIAEENFIKGGTNRVILCTDGDFNVGVTNTGDLQRLVEKKAKDTGVFISTLGFGRGNLNDAMMVAISDHGNGNYHYIDNRTEARRVLVEEMTGTLVTIAKDVKIQVEFNPAKVAGYRLIGYEKRALRTEDFNDDKKDAGEIGAGHTVTALYEIVPTGKPIGVAPVDPLKYQQPPTEVAGSNDKPAKSITPSKELLTLKMRYKAPDGDTSKKLEWPITDEGKSFAAASGDLKFAASVAGFGLLLRNSQYKGNLTYAADIELAQGGIGEDSHGYRKEFLDMVRKAKELRHE
jgi:Ca-activated chloride channel family protein